jgi:uncharacterized protein YjbJ (UPF0337 family)
LERRPAQTKPITRKFPKSDRANQIVNECEIHPVLTSMVGHRRRRFPWNRRGLKGSFAAAEKQKPNESYFMKNSTKDKIEGTARDLKGKVKETTGRAVGNSRLRDEGVDEQIAGKVQKKVGDVEKVFET